MLAIANLSQTTKRNAVPQIVLTLLLSSLLTSCSGSISNGASNTVAAKAEDKRITELHTDIKKIEPFFRPMGKPRDYDWLASHNEPGQTFDQYISGNPTLPTAERNTIYVLPLGQFTPQQKKIIDITAGYLEAFYGLPVKEMPRQDLKRPTAASDSRISGYPQRTQIRTGYILDSILAPKLPAEAAAFIALTNEDLFPDETMNYVFGQASLENRVGIWSLSRLSQNANYETFLSRTLKIASHETGHMFGIKHCTKYACLMSGANHIGETDDHPIDACPECMAKISWLSNTSPKDRYDRLAAFCGKNGLAKEAEEFSRKAQAVK